MAILLLLGTGVIRSDFDSDSCESSTVSPVSYTWVPSVTFKCLFRPCATTSSSKHTVAAKIPAPTMTNIGQTSLVPNADEPTVKSGSQCVFFALWKRWVFSFSNMPNSWRLIILKRKGWVVILKMVSTSLKVISSIFLYNNKPILPNAETIHDKRVTIKKAKTKHIMMTVSQQ